MRKRSLTEDDPASLRKRKKSSQNEPDPTLDLAGQTSGHKYENTKQPNLFVQPEPIFLASSRPEQTHPASSSPGPEPVVDLGPVSPEDRRPRRDLQSFNLSSLTQGVYCRPTRYDKDPLGRSSLAETQKCRILEIQQNTILADSYDQIWCQISCICRKKSIIFC